MAETGATAEQLTEAYHRSQAGHPRGNPRLVVGIEDAAQFLVQPHQMIVDRADVAAAISFISGIAEKEVISQELQDALSRLKR